MCVNAPSLHVVQASTVLGRSNSKLGERRFYFFSTKAPSLSENEGNETQLFTVVVNSRQGNKKGGSVYN